MQRLCVNFGTMPTNIMPMHHVSTGPWVTFMQSCPCLYRSVKLRATRPNGIFELPFLCAQTQDYEEVGAESAEGEGEEEGEEY